RRAEGAGVDRGLAALGGAVPAPDRHHRSPRAAGRRGGGDARRHRLRARPRAARGRRADPAGMAAPGVPAAAEGPHGHRVRGSRGGASAGTAGAVRRDVPGGELPLRRRRRALGRPRGDRGGVWLVCAEHAHRRRRSRPEADRRAPAAADRWPGRRRRAPARRPMNEWQIAATVLAFALVPCLVVCFLSGAAEALPALELSGALLSTIPVLLAEGFHRQPFVDLAVVLAPMSLIGAIAFARLMESGLDDAGTE